MNGLALPGHHEEQGGLNQRASTASARSRAAASAIWGARTLSSDPEWRYINVRRLFNFISESIIEGTQWAVFEPNDERLWTGCGSPSRLPRAASGATARCSARRRDEAFYVKCDAETNPPDRVDAGQADRRDRASAPVKPAEFVIFRISQFTGGGASEIS